MEFHTPLHIHSSNILTMGSCFAHVMGEKLQQNKFKVLVNPFGVIFNPLSIYKVLHASAAQKNIIADSFIESDGIWFNYDLHSDFSASSKEELNAKTNSALKDMNLFLKTANIITITFGTAFVYKLINNNTVVANCHKIPSTNFKKELLKPEEIIEGFGNIYKEIKAVNKNIKFIVTVSPVRHIKDTLELNSVSKCILRTSSHFIKENFSDVEYFPSYEIMMDDLRDYRFYKKDMIHPTEVAEAYIWDKFSDSFIEEESKDLLKKWEGIRKALEHKAFHPNSEKHKKFIKETIDKLRELSTRINVEEEIRILEAKLQ
jgi:hypothetical protein